MARYGTTSTVPKGQKVRGTGINIQPVLHDAFMDKITKQLTISNIFTDGSEFLGQWSTKMDSLTIEVPIFNGSDITVQDYDSKTGLVEQYGDTEYEMYTINNDRGILVHIDNPEVQLGNPFYIAQLLKHTQEIYVDEMELDAYTLLKSTAVKNTVTFELGARDKGAEIFNEVLDTITNMVAKGRRKKDLVIVATPRILAMLKYAKENATFGWENNIDIGLFKQLRLMDGFVSVLDGVPVVETLFGSDETDEELLFIADTRYLVKVRKYSKEPRLREDTNHLRIDGQQIAGRFIYGHLVIGEKEVVRAISFTKK